MTEPRADQRPPNRGHTPEPMIAEAATPAWIQMSTRPLEAALRGTGQDHIGAAATLWPFGQDSDAAARASRYVPDTIRHPQRTRAALTAYIIEEFSRPGRVVFDGFVGSGTTMVEAAYAGRHSIGVDQDIHWVDLTTRNVAFAHEHGATGNALVTWADTRDLTPIPRRLRHSVDLVLATPPLRFRPNDIIGRPDDATRVADLELDMRVAISSWMPLLHPGTTLVFTSRLLPGPGYLLDLTAPIASAARSAGLQLVERTVAPRVPIREATSRRARLTRGRRRIPVVHDDVLIYRVPSGTPQWWRSR